MIRTIRPLGLILPLILAACAQQPRPTTKATPPAIKAAPSQNDPARSSIGLAQIMGRTPEAVIALLGSPTLDRSEGQARHLQFVRGGCVLDIYFYPAASGTMIEARHAEARQPDGRSHDTAACIAAQVKGQKLS